MKHIAHTLIPAGIVLSLFANTALAASGTEADPYAFATTMDAGTQGTPAYYALSATPTTTSTTDYLGKTGVYNTLTLNDQSLTTRADARTNSFFYIGYGSTSSTNSDSTAGYGNRMILKGGSTWTLQNVGKTFKGVVGRYGCGNSLEISEGSSVSTNYDFLIGDGDSSHASCGSNNSVILTGTGENDTSTKLEVTGFVLYVGYSGSSNSLKIQSGADVSTRVLFIGYGDGTTSTSSAIGYGNRVTVTGTGSTLTTTAFHVGLNGSSNSLIVSDGGVVTSSSAYLGENITGVDNLAVVSGSGSQWTIDGALVVGVNGQGSLIIDNGALVKSVSITFGTASGTIDLTSDAMNGVTSLLTTDTGLTNALTESIYLGANSYLAVSGDLTTDVNATTLATLLSGMMVYDTASSAWVSAGSQTGLSIISCNYVDGTIITSSDVTDGQYEGLDDYTVFYYSITAVPEPSTYALFGGISALGLAVWRRRGK